MINLDRKLLPIVLCARATSTPDVAVCLVGQLRTGAEEAVQRNIEWAVGKTLDPDVFVYISREHETLHPIGKGGCIKSSSFCKVATGQRTSQKTTANAAGRFGTQRLPTTTAELEAFRHTGPLAKRIIKMEVLDDDAAVHQAQLLNTTVSNGHLVQRAMRARTRLCLEAIKEHEVEIGKRYIGVMRLRPDYAFDCRLPDLSQHNLPTLWASHHRDYWELMTRTAAEYGITWLWERGAQEVEACRPKEGKREVETKVESCMYLSLCTNGVVVRASDEYYTTAQARQRAQHDRRAPQSPGVIVRPCCDATRMHSKLVEALPNVTCDLDRDPILGMWFMLGFQQDGAGAWRAARERTLKHLQPNCKEQIADAIPVNDDDADDEEEESPRAELRL